MVAGMRRSFLTVVLAGILMLPGCQTVAPEVAAEVAARRERISAEPAGDYWVGRRVAGERTRFWGFVRRPRQGWDQARLVVFNEREKAAPDRLSEVPGAGVRGYRYDDNREYRLQGRFSGRQVYDPNSDKILPEFILQGYEEVAASPGWLFHPRERRDVYGGPPPPGCGVGVSRVWLGGGGGPGRRRESGGRRAEESMRCRTVVARSRRL